MKKYYKTNKMILKCGELEQPHRWGCTQIKKRKGYKKSGKKPWKTKYRFKKYPKEKFFRKYKPRKYFKKGNMIEVLFSVKLNNKSDKEFDENIKLYDESGESISCEVIGSFYSEETNHCYIIFKKSDEKIYASRYILENNMLMNRLWLQPRP